jgi:hypothetical protein
MNKDKPQIRFVGHQVSKKLQFLVDQAQDKFNIAPEQLIDILEKYIEQNVTVKFAAFLHPLAGNENGAKLINNEEEYDKLLESGKWFKSPYAATQEREKLEQKISKKKSKLESMQGKEEAEEIIGQEKVEDGTVGQ